MTRAAIAVCAVAVLAGCAGQRVGGIKVGVPGSWARADESEKLTRFTDPAGATVIVGTEQQEVEEGSRGATPHVCADQMAMNRGVARDADFTKLQLDGYPAYRVKHATEKGEPSYVLIGCDGFTSWFIEVRDSRGEKKLDELRAQLEPTIHYAHAGKAE
ncbi:MAG: hypothetical protein ACJ790_00585 [Myxococcaceae bacterium]